MKKNLKKNLMKIKKNLVLIGILVIISMLSLQCPFEGLLCNPGDEIPEFDVGDENNLGTRNPIILAHGMGGFDEIATFHYFGQTADFLESAGFYVYETQTSPLSSIEARVTEDFGYNGSRSFLEQIEDVVADRGAKAIIIGHSMGGLDARYLASEAGLGRDDLVSMVLSISTPHRGSEVADVALGILPGDLEEIVNQVLVLFGMTSTQDEAGEAFYDLTTGVSYNFNQTYVNNPNVEYYSVAGKGDGLVNLVAPFLVTYPIIKSYHGDNDGMVSVDSGKWGHFLGTWEADHGDECGTVLSYNPALGGEAFEYGEQIANALSQAINHYNNGTYSDQYSYSDY